MRVLSITKQVLAARTREDYKRQRRKGFPAHAPVECPLDGTKMYSPLRDHAVCKQCGTEWNITRLKSGGLEYANAKPVVLSEEEREPTQLEENLAFYERQYDPSKLPKWLR